MIAKPFSCCVSMSSKPQFHHPVTTVQTLGPKGIDDRAGMQDIFEQWKLVEARWPS